MTWKDVRKANPKAYWEAMFQFAMMVGMIAWTIALIIWG
jgi:hypothetical protein